MGVESISNYERGRRISGIRTNWKRLLVRENVEKFMSWVIKFIDVCEATKRVDNGT